MGVQQPQFRLRHLESIKGCNLQYLTEGKEAAVHYANMEQGDTMRESLAIAACQQSGGHSLHLQQHFVLCNRPAELVPVHAVACIMYQYALAFQLICLSKAVAFIG